VIGEILLQRPFHRTKQRSSINRFGKKVTCTFFYRAYRQWNVAAPGDEDDRYSASFGLKLCLQFNTRHARHANVGNQACGLVPGAGIQELLCGVEAERGHPHRFDQILQCALNRLVIVEDRQKARCVLDLHGAKGNGFHKVSAIGSQPKKLRLRW
jgi:hypothetical protein